MYNNNKISANQVTFLLIASIIEIGTLVGLRYFIKDVGPDMWIVNLIAYIFSIPIIIVMIKLSLRFPTYGFGEYSRIITGRVIGLLLSIIVVGYWILLNGRLLTLLALIVKFSMLERTPSYVVIIPYLIISAYMAWFGLESICRLCTLIVITIIPLIVLMSLTTLVNFQPNNLLPFLGNGLILVLKSGFKGISDLEELSYLLFLIPFMNNPQKAYKATLNASVVTWSLSIVGIIPLGVLGVETAKHYLMIPFVAIDSVQLSNIFIERLGTVFVGLWIIIAFPTVCSLLYASSLVLSQAFKVSSYKHFIIPVTILLIIISLLPESIMQADKFYKIMSNYGIIVLVVIPVLLYITSLIKKIKE